MSFLLSIIPENTAPRLGLMRRHTRARDPYWRIYAADQTRKLHMQGAFSCGCLEDRVLHVFSQIRIAYEWTEDYVIKYLCSAAVTVSSPYPFCSHALRNR